MIFISLDKSILLEDHHPRNVYTPLKPDAQVLRLVGLTPENEARPPCERQIPDSKHDVSDVQFTDKPQKSFEFERFKTDRLISVQISIVRSLRQTAVRTTVHVSF
jgi:hypothetical protein